MITAVQVKELRDRTGIGMMECKKALTASNGDIELAIEELRKKGLAKAASKADRETSEGAISIETEGNKTYVVSVSCETDFLSGSDNFKKMVAAVVTFLKENGTDSKEAAQEMVNKDFALELGENLQVRAYDIVEWNVGSYVHSNGKVAAIVVGKEGVDDGKLKQVAMHVTAANPEYLSPEDISEDVVTKEKEIQLEVMKNDPNMGNKSDDVLMKIIEGKMGKFKSEMSLTEQGFVMDPNTKVKDFIGAGNLVSFQRMSI